MRGTIGNSSPGSSKLHTLIISTVYRIEYVAKYASKDAADEAGEDTESDDELSSVGSYESGNEEPAGEMDDV